MPADWEKRCLIAGTICALTVSLLVVGYVVLEATGVLVALYKPLRDLERAAQTAGQVQEVTIGHWNEVKSWKAEQDALKAELLRERAENQALTEQIKNLSRAHAAEIRAVKKTEK